MGWEALLRACVNSALPAPITCRAAADAALGSSRRSAALYSLAALGGSAALSYGLFSSSSLVAHAEAPAAAAAAAAASSSGKDSQVSRRCAPREL